MFRGPYVTPPTEIRGGEGHHSILKLLLLVTSARLQNYFSPWCERWVKKRMKLWWCSRETLNITRKQFIPCSEMKMEVSGFRKLTFQRKILATNIKLCNALRLLYNGRWGAKLLRLALKLKLHSECKFCWLIRGEGSRNDLPTFNELNFSSGPKIPKGNFGLGQICKNSES